LSLFYSPLFAPLAFLSLNTNSLLKK
jgi:hypothetical protein